MKIRSWRGILFIHVPFWKTSFKPAHNKTNTIACAPSEDRSALASAQSDQSSLSACKTTGPLATYWAHSEISDQTGRVPRLIWVFAGRTCSFVGFVVRWLIYRFIVFFFGALKKNQRTYQIMFMRFIFIFCVCICFFLIYFIKAYVGVHIWIASTSRCNSDGYP